jgi:hypothetical protein
VIPEEEFVRIFIQLGDPHTILVGRCLLRYGVHADFRQIEIRPDADGRRDPGLLQHIPYHGHRHDVRRVEPLAVGFFLILREIRGRVDEGLVYAVYVDIAGAAYFRMME